jgi:tetratricopeptide (TPR) repeat protein
VHGGWNVSAERYRYKAFISYSHRDASVAQWLHKALETYRAPKHLIGRQTAAGTVLKSLGPLFRDRDELPVAADLTGQINEALAATQFLIVLCSTASAKSKWVNQEVVNFKRMKGAGSIIAVIVDGEPYASTMPGREAEECFAPALRFHVNADGALTDQPAEPIAADLRPGKDGKRLVKLKVLAGLLGVGLDELVQRETLRRQRFMTVVTFASLAGIGIMGALTFNAIEARNEAEVAQERAERQKGQAEGLIEFMLGDLRKKLEPVGRLDVLDSVGEKALGYFSSLSTDELDDDTMGRRSRSLHLIGEIEGLRGDLDSAAQIFEEAAKITGTALDRNQGNVSRLYEHSQSVYWLGYIKYRRRDFSAAADRFNEYEKYSRELVFHEPSNIRWLVELSDANRNLGVVHLKANQIPQAINEFIEAKKILEKVRSIDRDVVTWDINLGQTHAWLADAYRNNGQIIEAKEQRLNQIQIYEDLLSKDH